jgi:hypothetical protein
MAALLPVAFVLPWRRVACSMQSEDLHGDVTSASSIKQSKRDRVGVGRCTIHDLHWWLVVLVNLDWGFIEVQPLLDKRLI